jgi:glucoamylase
MVSFHVCTCTFLTAHGEFLLCLSQLNLSPNRLAAAEQLYDALYQWNKAGGINVTATSLPFFQQLVSSTEIGYYNSSSATYITLYDAVSTYADDFVALVAEYTPGDGALSEQYLKTTGAQTSAVDLTWSFAGALTAFDARAGNVPASWGASGLTTTCANNVVYIPITFNEYATTTWGQNIFIAGNITQLGNWITDDAIALSSVDYPTWSVIVDIPAGTPFQYKYINIDGSTSTCSLALRSLCFAPHPSFALCTSHLGKRPQPLTHCPGFGHL